MPENDNCRPSPKPKPKSIMIKPPVSICIALEVNNDSGLDLENLTAIRLDFGQSGTSAVGRIAIDDVEFTSDALFHPPPPPCPTVAPCQSAANCLKGSLLSSVDTGLSACRPATGPPLDCSPQTVHVMTHICDKASCCFDPSPCVCPSGNCPDGTYLELVEEL